MTMCAAITVPIIKDGYRLYPGMPVSSSVVQQNQSQSTNPYPYQRENMVINNRGQTNSQALYFTRQPSCVRNAASGSPPEGPAAASSPPARNANSATASNRVIVGGVTGAQVVLLQPRTRTTSTQPQISARSSLEVGPTQMNYWSEQAANRTAMSTSQLYVQRRRELCIQQQLQKQELAKKQQQLQQQQSQHPTRSESLNSNMSSIDDQRKRKTSSQGDPNNNSDSESTNPFRKLLRRLGFGSPSTTASASNVTHARHVTFESPIIGSDCESGIEQAVSASEAGVAVSAWN